MRATSRSALSSLVSLVSATQLRKRLQSYRSLLRGLLRCIKLKAGHCLSHAG